MRNSDDMSNFPALVTHTWRPHLHTGWATNQPKSGVLRKRRTSSPAWLNHSWNLGRYHNDVTGGKLMLTGLLSDWGPWHVQTRGYWAIATGEKWIRPAICPVRKGLWMDGCLGVEPRWMRSLFQKDSAIWGGSHFGWGPPWLGEASRALFQLYPGICLTTE
jgi:hypothetical protein